MRAYLDRAVVDAADRWVGRSLDATAYADLVAAVLARREAFGATRLTEPLDVRSDRSSWPVEPPRPPERAEPPETRDPEMDHLPDLRAWRGDPVTTTAAGGIRVESSGAVSYGPTSYELLTTPDADDLPTRPPGRHRSPATPEPAPSHIDLSDNLTSVLSWLGQPDS